jgi:hypothetical protein
MSNVLKNVELYWVKLDPANPVDPFNSNKFIWEIQMRTPEKTVAKSWKDMGLPVKTYDDNGATVYICNVKKLAKSAAGKELSPPRVVDGKLQPVDPNIIGNGSIGNIQLSPLEWSVGNKSGIVFDLMAVQVVKLIEYVGSNLSFDIVDIEPSSNNDAGLNDDFSLEDDDF